MINKANCLFIHYLEWIIYIYLEFILFFFLVLSKAGLFHNGMIVVFFLWTPIKLHFYFLVTKITIISYMIISFYHFPSKDRTDILEEDGRPSFVYIIFKSFFIINIFLSTPVSLFSVFAPVSLPSNSFSSIPEKISIPKQLEMNSVIPASLKVSSPQLYSCGYA